MTEIRALCCWTAIGDEIPPSIETAKEGDTKMIVMSQEQGKKSSFLLDLPFVLETPLETNLLIEHKSDAVGGYPFFLGGFQIISNAKQSKVFLTGEDQKETYLTTATGIPYDKKSGEDWFKAVCVIPGGPRRITRLHLKLLDVKHEMTKVKFLKLTARIPDPDSTAVSTTSTSAAVTGKMPPKSMPQIPVSLQQSYSSVLPGAVGGAITQDDLGAAMAGMSMMARSTEEAIGKSIKDQYSSMEKKLDERWNTMEGFIQSLTTVMVSQRSVFQEKNKIMMQQQGLIEAQARQIEELKSNQEELTSTVKALQHDISILCQRLGSNMATQNTAEAVFKEVTPKVMEEVMEAPTDEFDALEEAGDYKNTVLFNLLDQEELDLNKQDTESKGRNEMMKDFTANSGTVEEDKTVEEDTVEKATSEQKSLPMNENESSPDDEGQIEISLEEFFEEVSLGGESPAPAAEEGEIQINDEIPMKIVGTTKSSSTEPTEGDSPSSNTTNGAENSTFIRGMQLFNMYSEKPK